MGVTHPGVAGATSGCGRVGLGVKSSPRWVSGNNAVVDDIDLTDGRIFGRGFPHDVFTTLRREAPVYWQAFPSDFRGEHDPGFWVLSRYADVQAANRDAELFCSYDGPQLAIQPAMRGTMLVTMDGRDHVRQRRLISAGFTPRMVGRLEAQTREWAVSIIEQALERGTCDFVQDVAYQLPMHMIADIVGIPVDDREWVFGLTKELLAGSDTDHVASPDAFLAIQVQMFEYAKNLGVVNAPSRRTTCGRSSRLSRSTPTTGSGPRWARPNSTCSSSC